MSHTAGVSSHLPARAAEVSVEAELERLSEVAAGHARASRAPNTLRAYKSDWTRFARWCATHQLSALPAQPLSVAQYLAAASIERTVAGAWAYAPATMARWMAAVAWRHHLVGELSPTDDPKVTTVLAGIRRERKRPPRRVLPLVTDDVRTLIQGMDFSHWPAGVKSARDAAAILFGYAGAMRRSEIAALSVGDIAWDGHDGLQITINSSKTDQVGEGALVALPFGQSPTTCPPCVWVRWLDLLANADQGRLPVLQRVLQTTAPTRWEHVCRQAQMPDVDPGRPLFPLVHRTGRIGADPLTGNGLTAMVQTRVTTILGRPGEYGWHSLRAGFVTQARRNKADNTSIRRQTRHTSDAMLDVYDRRHNPLEGNAVAALGL